MDGGQIGILVTAIGLAVSGILAAVVAAWISLRKTRSETEAAARNGVLEEWREITDKLQASHTRCLDRGKEQEKEIKELWETINKLQGEISALRTQVTARETERVEQRGEIRSLEKKVAEVEKADPALIADKVVEALAASTPTKVEIVPAGTPLPVKEAP